MSAQSPGTMPARELPARPNLEHLKNEAKQRLKSMRGSESATKLSDAQFRVAREYGFASWRDLKAEIDRRNSSSQPEADRPGRLGRYVGYYRFDPAVMTNSVIAVTEEGGHLYAQLTGGVKTELLDQGENIIAPQGLPIEYAFETSNGEPATAMVSTRDNASLRLERTDQAAAERAQADFSLALADQKRTRTEIAVPAEILDRYAGNYVAPFGAAFEVTREGNRLFARLTGQSNVEIYPETETAFFYRILSAQISFVLEGSHVTALILHQTGRGQRFLRVTAEEAGRASALIEEKLAAQRKPRTVVKVDAGMLAGYAGRYQMQLDPQRALTVTAENDRLFIEMTDQPLFEVYPESERDFFWTVVAAQISFIADGAGRVIHAVVHQYGREYLFLRV